MFDSSPAFLHGLCFSLPMPFRWPVQPRKLPRSLGSRACSFSTCSWLSGYAGSAGNSQYRFPQCCLPVASTRSASGLRFSKAQFPARRCLCLRFTRILTAPSARLEVKMVCYSFLVGLFHPRLHAGLSRRLRLPTRAARKTRVEPNATNRTTTVRECRKAEFCKSRLSLSACWAMIVVRRAAWRPTLRNPAAYPSLERNGHRRRGASH